MKVIADILARLTHLEQRLAAMGQHGPVHEVDTKEKKARLRLGGTDEEPFLGPWISYVQQAGDLKVHAPPTKGQNMTIWSPSGVPEHGTLMPLSWNNANPSPSDKDDENVLTFGDASAHVTKEYVRGKLKDARFVAHKDFVKIRFDDKWVVATKDGIFSSHPIEIGPDPKPEL